MEPTNSPIYTPNECICSKEPHSSRQKPIHRTCQQAVAEEQQIRNEALDVKLHMVVPHAVQEDPKCASAADEEGPPPPVIILIPVSTPPWHFEKRKLTSAQR